MHNRKSGIILQSQKDTHQNVQMVGQESVNQEQLYQAQWKHGLWESIWHERHPITGERGILNAKLARRRRKR